MEAKHHQTVLAGHEHILNAFISTLSSHTGWVHHEPEGLVVSYFPNEFNRCIDHLSLNKKVGLHQKDDDSAGWYYTAPACRVNDMRKVDSGWHSTFFELLVSVGFYQPGCANQAANEIASDVLIFLTERLGLSKGRLYVTQFMGGEVIPGITLEEDTLLREAWLKAGLHESNLIPVYGPKNYVLFVGNGERCGPKSEILYEHQTPNGSRLIEVGTVILDNARFRGGSGEPWVLDNAMTVAAGVAYGLERLITVTGKHKDLSETPIITSQLSIVRHACSQAPSSWDMLKGDALTLVDQVRTGIFLLALKNSAFSQAQNEILKVIARRIRRKLATLCVQDWSGLVCTLEDKFILSYGARYPELSKNQGKLLSLINQVPWPEGWNPETYVGISP